VNRRRAAARVAVSAVAAVGIVLAGCAPTAPRPTPSALMPTSPAASDSPPVEALDGSWRPEDDGRALVGGLTTPWSAISNGGAGLLISQRDVGDVVEWMPGAEPRTVGRFADAVAGGEGGLHGLALWAEDDRTWLYAYVGAADDNRVVRAEIDGEPGSWTLGSAEPVITGIPRGRIHNGGRIAFGPDGLLYVATGDAAVPDAAQDPASLGGKILRLTAEGDPAAGNPFGTEVYSLGHRNVQGLAWTADGQLWATEFGQDAVDEVNRIDSGGNYGWPVHEGVAEADGFVDPVVTWVPAEASPSGLAAAGQTLFVAALRGERVWAVDVAAGRATAPPEELWAGRFGRIRDAVVIDDRLLLLTSNTDQNGRPGADDDRLIEVRLRSAG
jgi:glucose/arabinose dehydrogenase